MKTLELSRSLLNREIIISQTQARVFAFCVFIVLTALGAYVRIPLPFTPVPITLQTFFVILAGAVLGSRWGMFSQLAYLALGVGGLPIFAGANFGWGVLLGPTGGYLVGFIAACWLVGRIISAAAPAQKRRILLAMLSGALLIELSGCIWLRLVLGLSWKKALLLGLWPFLPGDMIKAAAACLVYQGLRTRTKEILG